MVFYLIKMESCKFATVIKNLPGSTINLLSRPIKARLETAILKLIPFFSLLVKSTRLNARNLFIDGVILAYSSVE